MAVKTSSLTYGTGKCVWKYIPSDTPPQDQNFPGLQNAGNCGAEAGDILIIKSVKPLAPGGIFTADTNGFRPHIAIYPGTNNLADPNHVAKGKNGREDQFTAVPGWPWTNDESPPCIRVDFGAVYLRWNCGSIQVEGGSGPGGDAGTLVITYLWDRPRILKDRAGWGLRTQLPKTHRLTLYTVPRGTIIQRPLCASRIWTPDNTTITGNLGGSTVNFDFNNASSVPLPIGPCDSFTPTADTSLILFELDL